MQQNLQSKCEIITNVKNQKIFNKLESVLNEHLTILHGPWVDRSI